MSCVVSARSGGRLHTTDQIRSDRLGCLSRSPCESLSGAKSGDPNGVIPDLCDATRNDANCSCPCEIKCSREAVTAPVALENGDFTELLSGEAAPRL